MTPVLVEAIEQYQTIPSLPIEDKLLPIEPSLGEPKVGNPISHSQIIEISKYIRGHIHLGGPAEASAGDAEGSRRPPSYHLDELLRGSQVYIAPPKPRNEPTSEFKALMSRLLHEEEDRAYERLINPPPAPETFAQRFLSSPHAHSSSSHTLNSPSDEDDEITYADVDRQMALILNIVISIVACSVAIWLVSSRWSTPKRLGLSMGGSGVVGVAEVVVYAGYLRRLREAKEKGKKHVEVKEIIKTWVIGGDEGKDQQVEKDPLLIKGSQDTSVKKRRGRKK
ncbi:MAG: hypothetical protein M1827_001673 [Pycnora praestabilis]|nr:MAG: hypothetical protein M1827_001673 [Pycnora praestabilis]